MPFINVKTNKQVAADVAESVKSKLGQAVTAIPGKSEGWLMVGLEDGGKLWFKGSDAPAAMVQVSIFGSASSGALTDLTGRICGIMSTDLGIPADRVYVSYMCTDNWGWNNMNF
ncbi:MAG: hypothetical protein IKO27_07105 [Ruminococcus sp.]|nr:hypothetical protein [Ruminococcus sp.]